MRMVEKVAIAIMANPPRHRVEVDGEGQETIVIDYAPTANAAMVAMREPDDEMAKAGIAAWEKSPMAVVTQFRAMIDKALEDAP